MGELKGRRRLLVVFLMGVDVGGSDLIRGEVLEA